VASAISQQKKKTTVREGRREQRARKRGWGKKRRDREALKGGVSDYVAREGEKKVSLARAG